MGSGNLEMTMGSGNQFVISMKDTNAVVREHRSIIDLCLFFVEPKSCCCSTGIGRSRPETGIVDDAAR